ncbi:hypothetical protein OAQ99_03830 [Candidatus Kapabacteria bacterium]|nr:hypothetical protein [Candidatus Kapabacteria bacterium]
MKKIIILALSLLIISCNENNNTSSSSLDRMIEDRSVYAKNYSKYHPMTPIAESYLEDMKRTWVLNETTIQNKGEYQNFSSEKLAPIQQLYIPYAYSSVYKNIINETEFDGYSKVSQDADLYFDDGLEQSYFTVNGIDILADFAITPVYKYLEDEENQVVIDVDLVEYTYPSDKVEDYYFKLVILKKEGQTYDLAKGLDSTFVYPSFDQNIKEYIIDGLTGRLILYDDTFGNGYDGLSDPDGLYLVFHRK